MSKDDVYREQLLSSIDEEALGCIKEKSIEYIRLMSYYRCAMMELETKFKVLREQYSISHDRNPINSIQTRLKSPKSIREKVERLGFEHTIESIEGNLNDVAGIRVICAFKEDVYVLADTLLKQDDIKLIKIKDYIKNPKENGYRSLHMIVSIPIFLSHEKREMTVEVQFRTIAMDSWASMEHQIVYKKDVKLTPEMQAELDRCAELSAELDEKMDNLRKSVSEKMNEE